MNEQYFITKQNNLYKALAKVREILIHFKNGLRQDVENWNKYHDLEYRIEGRIKDNYCDYCSYFFDKNGWVAI